MTDLERKSCVYWGGCVMFFTLWMGSYIHSLVDSTAWYGTPTAITLVLIFAGGFAYTIYGITGGE